MLKNIVFFEIEKIFNLDSLKIIKQKKLFFSYFQIDQKYYILIFAEKTFAYDFLYKFLTIIQELKSRKRLIRSFRGFFIYALKMINQGKNFQVLETNLKPYFWTEIGNVIRQNRKSILLNFLFGTPSLENYQNQINFLKERIAELEKENLLIKNE